MWLDDSEHEYELFIDSLKLTEIVKRTSKLNRLFKSSMSVCNSIVTDEKSAVGNDRVCLSSQPQEMDPNHGVLSG